MMTFPVDALSAMTMTRKAIHEQRAKWALTNTTLNATHSAAGSGGIKGSGSRGSGRGGYGGGSGGIRHSARQYDRCPLCVFCGQFFKHHVRYYSVLLYRFYYMVLL
jgi:hypothetical protein